MAYERKDGDISIFLVTDKEGNENRPDYKGSALINGQKYYVSMWLKKPREGGNTFLAGQIQLGKAEERVTEDPIQNPPASTDTRTTEEIMEAGMSDETTRATPPPEDDLPFILLIPLALGSLLQFLI
jgi:hypothetical protein